MDATIIRFPVERRHAPAPQGAAVGFGPMPVPKPRTDPGQPFAILSVEIRRVAGRFTEITPEIAEKVLNRCLLAAMEVLAVEEATMILAGTPGRPVIEGRFHGDDGARRAVRAADAVRAAVRRCQRATENEFQVAGAVTVGQSTRTESGVRVTLGRPEAVAVRLRENAPPGQIVLSGPAWAACEDLVDVLPAGDVTMLPGAEPVQVYAVRSLRARPS